MQLPRNAFPVTRRKEICGVDILAVDTNIFGKSTPEELSLLGISRSACAEIPRRAIFFQRMQYKWTALTVTTVGTLMSGLDGRIVIIGLPTIALQLHAGAEEVIWITQAYLLASTVSMLLVGRIADVFGRVKLYNYGFILFTVGSALSSLSFDPSSLIAFRVLQGVGGGVLFTNATTIITDASPRKELGSMLGINQMAIRIGNMSGLTLSGLILSFVDWRGLFYVNIPIGIFGTIWAHKRLKEIAKKDAVGSSSSPRSAKENDWAGFSLFSIGLTFVLLAITLLSYGLSGTTDGFVLLFLGFGLLVAFVLVESGARFPLLDLQLFKIKEFAMGNLAQLLNSLAFAGIILLFAFYLQIGLGYSPLAAGLAILPLDGTYLVSTVVFGRLSDRYSSRSLTTIGLLMNTFTFFGMATFAQSTPYSVIAIALTIVGIGNGMFTPPNLRAIMGSVPQNRIGVAAGFRNTMFDVGLTTSYGLVILFITLGIPYASFSLLLQGAMQGGTNLLATTQFLAGFRITALILAVIDAVAVLPSAMRGVGSAKRAETQAFSEKV